MLKLNAAVVHRLRQALEQKRQFALGERTMSDEMLRLVRHHALMHYNMTVPDKRPMGTDPLLSRVARAGYAETLRYISDEACTLTEAEKQVLFGLINEASLGYASHQQRHNQPEPPHMQAIRREQRALDAVETLKAAVADREKLANLEQTVSDLQAALFDALQGIDKRLHSLEQATSAQPDEKEKEQ